MIWLFPSLRTEFVSTSEYREGWKTVHNSTAPILCVYGCISADFVLNYGHKSRFNLLRSVVFELFVMLMGGGGLVGWALLWNYDLLCWLFPLAAGCGV